MKVLLRRRKELVPLILDRVIGCVMSVRELCRALDLIQRWTLWLMIGCRDVFNKLFTAYLLDASFSQMNILVNSHKILICEIPKKSVRCFLSLSRQSY